MARSYVSSVITPPIEKVWAMAPHFGDVSYFESAESYSLRPGDTGSGVEAIRSAKRKVGGAVQKRLLSFSDPDHAMTYKIIDNPALPFVGYVAEFNLIRSTRPSETLSSGLRHTRLSNKGDCRSRITSRPRSTVCALMG